MDTIFMNSENSKTSKPHVLTFNFTDKIDFRKFQHGSMNLNYQVDHT